MLYALSYIGMGAMLMVIVVIGIATGDASATESAIKFFNEWYTPPNTLIAFGIISICKRVDALKKEPEGGDR